MKVISLMNFKGGCGKTTITCMLSLYLAEKFNKKVAIRDLDVSASSKSFIRLINTPNIQIFAGGEDYDYLFVDTPGGISPEALNELLDLSDLVIIPMSLSPTDVQITRKTINSIPEASHKKIRLLFNKVKPRTQAFKSRGTIATAMGVNHFPVYISDRIGYSYALVNGLMELDQKAQGEIEALIKEINK